MIVKNPKYNFNRIYIGQFYKPMLLLLLICGYNFNFYDKTFFIKVITWVYCISLVVIISVNTAMCCVVQEISQVWSLIEYFSSVLIILCFKSQMRTFLHRLGDIDKTLRINCRRYRFEKYKSFFFTVVTWMIRGVFTYLYCISYQCYNNLFMYLISQFSLISLDVNRVWRYVLFDMIRYRLKVLRERLEELPNSNFYLYVINNKTIKEDKMRFLLHVYKNIADSIELVKPELSASLFLSVACSLPKIIANVYNFLLILEDHESYESLGFVVMHTFQIAFLLFTPFVIVELYAVEIEKIKLYLIHRLINEDSPAIKSDIDMFLRYIETRPMKYRIFRIIPVNMTLPLELINLCVTYVIVLINFTHLYG